MLHDCKRKVLVVDDDRSAVGALVKLLSVEGFDARPASSGPAALKTLSEDTPHVVVSDLNMPEMDGLGLLARLRHSHPEVPLILATAVNDVPTALAAMRAGAADYVTKPIDPEALVFAIERAIRTYDLAREATALHERNEELARAAERNLRAREELLAVVAHDLRAPLSTIVLAANPTIPARDPGDGARRLAIVERSAQRATKLVDDLLDVARIDMGSLALELSPQPASAILSAVQDVVEPISKAAEVELIFVLPSDFVVRCAFERIAQVLINLVSNAVSVTKRGRRVRVCAERRSHHGWFAVEDEGAGIPPDQLPQVFERGFRSGGRRRGAGLGLAIVKGIVDAHGGHVGVESSVGAGSVFHIEIPIEGSDRTSWSLLPDQKTTSALL